MSNIYYSREIKSGSMNKMHNLYFTGISCDIHYFARSYLIIWHNFIKIQINSTQFHILQGNQRINYKTYIISNSVRIVQSVYLCPENLFNILDWIRFVNVVKGSSFSWLFPYRKSVFWPPVWKRSIRFYIQHFIADLWLS